MARICPYCKSEVQEKQAGIWPFCSERCKMSDLGAWMREDYRIAGGPVLDEEFDESADTDSDEDEFNNSRH